MQRKTYDKIKVDPNGFARVDVVLTNAGVMEYEDGKGYLPLEELEKLASKKHNLVLVDDHNGDVTPANYKQQAVGHVDSNLKLEGNKLVGEAVVIDKSAMESVVEGKRDVSIGYGEFIDRTPGVYVDEDGVSHPYDYVKRNLVLNHLAICEEGRASEARLVFDSNNTLIENDLETMETIELKIQEEEEEEGKETDAMSKMLDAVSKKLEDMTKQYCSLKEENDGLKAAMNLKKMEKDAQDSLENAELAELEAAKAAEAKQQELELILDAWRSVGGFESTTVKFDSKLTASQIKKAHLQALVGDSLDLSDKDDAFLSGLAFALDNQVVKVAPKKASDAIEKATAEAKPSTNDGFSYGADGSRGLSIFKR